MATYFLFVGLAMLCLWLVIWMIFNVIAYFGLLVDPSEYTEFRAQLGRKPLSPTMMFLTGQGSAMPGFYVMKLNDRAFRRRLGIVQAVVFVPIVVVVVSLMICLG
ncbi:hypothetical protein HKCCE3408_17290 [Rhodobacterales bacterium HKCCE3408]|nr:hypothetical protein [Rhodobacterales bacterium HKCCE3408]